MAIDLSKFVDINIVHHATSTASSIRDTVTLITSEGTTGNDNTFSSQDAFDNYVDEHTTGDVAYTDSSKYATVFFNNGGVKLRLLEGIATANIQSTIAGLADNYILVAVTGFSLDDAHTYAKALDTSNVGIHRKLLLARATNDDISDWTKSEVADTESLIVKYSNVVGAELSIAAYLTKIDIYGVNTVHDYSFTIENLAIDGLPPVDNDLFDKLQSYHFNFVISLVNQTRNIGGDTVSGHDLVNEYLLIVLHQTLTERLVNLLTQKIKGNRGLALISTTMTEELNRFVTNGYLATNKTWDSTDWTVDVNGTTYTIVAANTPLTTGYIIRVLPWTSLTSEEQSQHKTPQIYVALADSVGIRTISVEGEVI